MNLKPQFNTFREFLNGDDFIAMMQKINEHMMRSLRSQKYNNKTIEITDVVYNI